MKILHIALIIEALFIAGLVAGAVYFYTEQRAQEVVINNQGNVIRAIVSIPEINALILREIQNAQANAPAQ